MRPGPCGYNKLGGRVLRLGQTLKVAMPLLVCCHLGKYFDVWFLKKQIMRKKNAQIATNYTFFNEQKHLQNYENLNMYSRKNENLQIPFKGVCAKICAKYLFKDCAIWLLLFQAFQRAIKC